MMSNKLLAVKRAFLRLMLALVVSCLAGAVPAGSVVSYAAEAIDAQAEAPAEEAAKGDGSTFILIFFGGILLLILFVVVVVVATAVSTAGVVGAQEDE